MVLAMEHNNNIIDVPVGSAVGTSGSCAVISSSPVPSGLAPTSGNSPCN